jgi:hypothetical protein
MNLYKLFGILIISFITLYIFLTYKRTYRESFSNKLAKINGSELYFIHIPKNAGTAIIKHCCNNDQAGHVKIKDINDINIVKNSIAVIRNPYDRLYSIYEYTKLGKGESYWNADEKLYKYMNSHTFKEFINDLYLNNITFKDQVHLPPQTDFITWGDGNIYTKLVRFEHLNEDLSKYTGRHISIPYENKTSKKNNSWQSFYTNDMKSKVKELYKDDFILFEKLNNSIEGFQNLNKLIDGVLYINLAHRTDRKKHIEKELDKISSICNTIERIDAIKHNNGAKGCGMSHIKALEYAKQNKWSNVLIVEDDLIFKNITLIETITDTLDKLTNEFDVLIFSGNILKQNNININHLAKPINVQTTSCYLINSHYFDTLINVFKESVEKLKYTNNYSNSHKWAIDRHWFKLQEKDNWYIFKPTIAYQMEDYSDIEKKHVNYKV